MKSSTQRTRHGGDGVRVASGLYSRLHRRPRVLKELQPVVAEASVYQEGGPELVTWIKQRFQR